MQRGQQFQGQQYLVQVMVHADLLFADPAVDNAYVQGSAGHEAIHRQDAKGAKNIKILFTSRLFRVWKEA